MAENSIYIPKRIPEERFSISFEKLVEQWDRRITSEGSFLENE